MSEKKIYCGAKKLPRNRQYGNRTQCYKLGLKVGYVAGINRPIELSPEQIQSLSGDSVKALAGAYGISGYRNSSVRDNQQRLKQLKKVDLKKLLK